MGAVGWSAISAFLGGLGIVLQQKGAMAAPPARSRGFVAALVRNPVWVAGAACQFGCWASQGIALSRGPLSLVQPIVALQIVIALPLGVAITSQHVGRREWTGAALVVIGVTVFVTTTHASSGRSTAPADVWLAATAAVAVAVAAAAIVGTRMRPSAKAAFYGAAAGVLFGFQAAVMKAFVGVVPNGIGAILTSWSTYALILSALGGFYLMQTSLQVGVLAPTIAASNAACPITSVALGRVIFLETPVRTTGGKIVSAVSLLLLVVGLALVARGEAAAAFRQEDRADPQCPPRADAQP